MNSPKHKPLTASLAPLDDVAQRLLWVGWKFRNPKSEISFASGQRDEMRATGSSRPVLPRAYKSEIRNPKSEIIKV